MKHTVSFASFSFCNIGNVQHPAIVLCVQGKHDTIGQVAIVCNRQDYLRSLINLLCETLHIVFTCQDNYIQFQIDLN